MSQNLLENLPLKSVSVRRFLFPSMLEIELLEKTPIAFASRRGSKGVEQGMITKEGNWMPLIMTN